MNEYKKVFPKKHTLLVVIHVENADQATRNVRIALNEGADGVFLINHKITAKELLSDYRTVGKTFPLAWIGLNFLGAGNNTALSLIDETMDGLWIDDAGIQPNHCSKDTKAREFAKEKRAHENKLGEKFLLFGGVAFKYQERVWDYERAAKLAVPHMEVITTSGDRTGEPPSIKKMRSMRKGAGKHPLAIASGITPENVREYMRYADCFLVATGISDSHTELNFKRVRELANILNS